MLSKTDTRFLTRAAMSNTFELDASQLALSRSTTPADQMFAKQMISDHTKLGAEVKKALTRVDPGMALPVGVSEAQQRLLDKLKAAGKNFDRVYKAEMLSSHAQAAKLFSTYSGSRRANPTLKAVAMGGLPTIKMHLNEARTLPKM